jgi:chitinase
MKSVFRCAALAALGLLLFGCSTASTNPTQTISSTQPGSTNQPANTPADRSVKVIAYYMGDGSDLGRYNFNQLTHIIYSFLHLQGNQLGFDSAKDQKTMRQLVALKQQYPHLKVLLSLGGWGGCETCSDIFSSAANRQVFAQSTLKIIQDYHADGIDLDWEYPTIEGFPGHKFAAHDRDNFSELVRELRKALGADYELSFAAGGFDHYLATAVDWKTIMPLLDNVNLMTYDIVNGGTPHTGHHTALYSTQQQKDSTDNAVQHLLRLGVAPEKIVIGTAFYARVWKEVAPGNKGLYQPGVHIDGASFKEFPTQFTASKGFTYHWDDIAKAPFYYSTQQKVFATFDDERSLGEKVKYLRAHKLGGIMFWQLPHDTDNKGLLDSIHQNLTNSKKH